MRKIVLILAVCTSARLYAQPIQDNSFLVEEAYNQTPGVVQHIQTFSRSTKANDWVYSFTQEWPAPGLKHQLSYTLLLQQSGGERGIGDVALNYRYQWIGSGDTRLAVSPRVSVLLPSGDEKRGFGEGAAGLQVMLPVSTVLTPSVVAHWNAGATWFRDDNRSLTLANSVVWLARPRVNALVETVWTRTDAGGAHDNALVVSPGVRWSYDFPSGLQIVPGIAVPLGVGPHHDDPAVFLYLSFEHPFRKE